MRRAFRQAPPYIRDQVHRQLEQTRYQRLLRSRYPWVIAFRHDSTLTCIYCLGGKPGLRLLVERKAWPMIQAAGDPDKMPPGCDDREDEKNAWSAQADLNAEAFYDWERRDHLSHEEPSCQTEVVRFSEPRLGEPLEFGAVVFDVPEDPSEYDELDERLRLSY